MKQNFCKQKKNFPTKNKICVLGVVSLIIIICVAGCSSNKARFSSADEMKDAVQGYYVYYLRSGSKSIELLIEDDMATMTMYSSSGSSIYENEITEWNYKKGTFKALWTYNVLSDGTIDFSGDILEKEALPQEEAGSSSSSGSSAAENAYNVLKISDISITNNSSYTVCTGKVTNNGEKTYSFVKVKGSFMDASGNTLDTDSTYAVGSEGLAPGESTSFRLSVSKDTDITDCSVSVYDYK